MATILVVDDEIGIRELLSEILADEGHTVRLAENAASAREQRNRARPDLVLLDIWMPDIDGISLLKEWAAAGQLTMPVIMMSGHATIDTAVEATRIGAMEFLEKPIAMQKLLATVKRALRASEPQTYARFAPLNIGRSPAIADLRRRLAQYAQVNTPLLLRGEAGAMAELYARALHQPGMPFVVAGSALSEAPQPLLAQAAGGVLFVDELGALSKAQQRGLAFLVPHAERQKVRLVCFTTYAHRELVVDCGLDEGLLAHVSQLVLALPPLRAQAEDIPDLATSLLTQLIETRVSPPRSFAVAALNVLRQHPWPRNMEELHQVVRSAALTALDAEISAEDVQHVLPPPPPQESVPLAAGLLDLPLREAREEFERTYFEHHLARDVSMSRLAEKSGLERTHLYRKLKALGLHAGKKEE